MLPEQLIENSRVRISEKTCPTDDVRKLAATEVGNGVVKFYTDSEIIKDITVILEKIGKWQEVKQNHVYNFAWR